MTPRTRTRRGSHGSVSPLTTTRQQRGGVTGKGFLPGQYGESGATIYARLEALYTQPKTPAKLKAHINFFLIERLHGRAPQRVEVDGGTSLLELLADVVGRDRSEADR